MELERRLMEWLARFVIRYRRWIPVAALVLLVLATFSAGNLQVKTQVKDLLPEENPMVASWDQIIEEFNGGESIFVMVEGPTKAAMANAAEEFVATIMADRETSSMIQAVNLRVNQDFISDWGLLLQKPRDLNRLSRTFESVNLLPLLRSLNDGFEDTYNTSTAEEELANRRQETDAVAMYQQMESFFTALRNFIEEPDTAGDSVRGRDLAELFFFGEPYSFAWDNSMLVFSIVPSVSVLDMDRTTLLSNQLRTHAAAVEKNHPGIDISETGNIPIQADESAAMGMDMLIPAVVALLLILVLFVFSFTQLRSVVMVLGVLVAAIVYNYGLAGITVREITMMTSLMSTLLVGLGIDYGIQVVTNFNAFRTEGHNPEDAVLLTFQKAGMGTLLAAFTTAVAFLVMALTGSKAFAQFGFMAASGIMLCFLSMVIILPSMLLLWGRSDVTRSRIPKINYAFLGKFARILSRHRIMTLSVGGAVTAVLLWAAVGLKVEYNFMNLEPQNTPSIQAYYRLTEKMRLTPSQSMIVADSIDEAHTLTDRLENEPLVADVVSVARFLPTSRQSEDRLSVIRGLRRQAPRFGTEIYEGEKLDELLYEIQRVEWNLTEIGDLSVAGLGENNRIVSSRNRIIHEVLGAEVGKSGEEVFQNLIRLIESDPGKFGRRLTELDAKFSPAASEIVDQMIAVDRPITGSDLPSQYRASFFDSTMQRNLVTIFPRDGMWENLDEMKRFGEDTARVDPRITGSTQLGVAWTEESFDSSVRAGIYILIVVILTLLLEFRSVKWAAAAAFPLVVGMVWMLGIYPLLGLKINPINLTMAPMIIGMAVDFGIHLVHRHRQEHDLFVTYTHTGKAVFLSAATTMIGFGSLALMGEFASVALIGAILFLGIASALLVSWTILPGLLKEKVEVLK